MTQKRYTAEQIIIKLREAEVGLAQGQTVGQVSKRIAVTEQTYYRWRKEYGGMCCNFQKSARGRLVGSTRLRLMQPLRTAC